jgi:vesicle transport through interaction with t-SNAREs protein 1
LAGTRSRVTLQECERLLAEAKKSAGAMQGLAEVEGNPMKIREASQRLERDISPLAKEVQRALGEENREELFYQAPSANDNGDMESLIQSSEDLLRESQALCIETEQVGGNVILQMADQREQLENTRSNIDATREYAAQAAVVLGSMSRKAFQNKLFLYIFIGVLLVANLFALIKMFRRSN